MAIYVCSYKNCSKVFHRPSKLKNHYNLHFGMRPFICTISGCDKSYSSSSHLQRHIKSSHVNQTDTKMVFACSYKSCDATFQTLWGLQRHEDNHLTPFHCQKCNLHFKTDVTLNNHMKRHEIVANRKCRFCGKDFSNKLKKEFLRHEKTHLHYKCDFCNKTFSSLKEFQRHLVNHESKFECAHCGVILKRKNSLRTHIQTLHLAFLEPFVCEEINCPKVYHYKRNCTKHKMLHDEQVRFKCPVANCCQEFLHKKSYNHHLQLHQNNRIAPKTKLKNRKVIDSANSLVNVLCS